MLAEESAILDSVAAGTLMGDLLRRYWMPVLLSDELADRDGAPVRVRVLGEDLVAFRDGAGAIGLLEEHCPHRGASLYFGRNEECGLRCVYHGWKFDASGRCVDMPNEQRPFKDRVTQRSYPTHEAGGMIWAYLGPPETISPFRDFGIEDIVPEEIAVTKYFTRCGWLQSIEGSIDTAHVSFLHQWNGIDDIPDDGTDKPGYETNAMSWKIMRHDSTPRLEFDMTWFGFRYAGLRTTPNGYTQARVGTFIFPSCVQIPTVPFSSQQSILVPIDETSCWRYMFKQRAPANPRRHGGAGMFEGTPYETTTFVRGHGTAAHQEATMENDYLIDRDAQRQVSFTGVPNFMAQDLMVTESMGAIADRTREHLGATDLAVTRLRSILLQAARGLSTGEQPPALAASDRDFRSIRAADKILDEGEDWRILGTDADPAVREGLAAVTAGH